MQTQMTRLPTTTQQNVCKCSRLLLLKLQLMNSLSLQLKHCPRQQDFKAANKALDKLFSTDCEVQVDDVSELLTHLSEDQKVMFDEAEVKDGERSGITSDGTLTFSQLCKAIKLPQELWDTYAEWLSRDDRPGGFSHRKWSRKLRALTL